MADEDEEDDGGASAAYIVRRRFPRYKGLRELLLAELAIYGRARADPDVFRAIGIAYPRINSTLAVADRTEIYQMILARVLDGDLHANALVPVAIFDDFGALASRAAIDVCMTHPSEPRDAAAGVSLLGSFLSVAGVANRGALFGGLLCLGDRRSHPWLRKARDQLTISEIDQFARVATGMISSSAVEFVLDWMEARPASCDDYIFNALAAWLVNQRNACMAPHVVTGSRAIPAGCVSDVQEDALLRLVVLGRYVEAIAPRLFALYHADSKSDVMEHVISVYGGP